MRSTCLIVQPDLYSNAVKLLKAEEHAPAWTSRWSLMLLERDGLHAVRDPAGQRRSERRERDHDDDPDVAHRPPAGADAECEERGGERGAKCARAALSVGRGSPL